MDVKMTQQNASRLDLNILKLFVVLYQEKNMRRAAARLHVSQPAVSHSLKKLREHFNDQLFVKVPQGLEPTPLAHQIAKIASSYIEGLTRELNSLTDFDPKDLEQTIRIAIAGPIFTSIAGNLHRKIRQVAPNIQLEIVSWNHQTPDDLAQNKVLLAINYGTLQHTKQINSKKLVDINPTVIIKKDHPLANKSLELSDFGHYEIASLIIPGWNDEFVYASDKLKEYGVDAKVGIRSEVLLALIDIISQTDMYIPHNNLFPIQHFPHLKMLSVKSLVPTEDYQFSVHCFFHIKDHHSKVVNWISGLIKDCLLDQIDTSAGYCDQ
ncbi:LysR family transcriptional regulator [Photobacterium rosenbergii]|uniref:LysR family transcriptional regulator n=1 Tax=Photobacterium rosenbergii TaxID=294936 RepID=A0A2T3NL54_9GAMM|nr:LysR family transcriptional regulator [Photobacterium rosenbergii]PSW16172.1 LysR family transcriptional regulator [Photobacterium rosenbergii]